MRSGEKREHAGGLLLPITAKVVAFPREECHPDYPSIWNIDII
jgi:hypothetical protein